MRRFVLSVLAASLCALSLSARQADADSLFRLLEKPLGNMLVALQGTPIPVQCAQCDTLVLSVADTAVRRRVALYLYDHYRHSPLMGVEAVAIHLADRWFLSGAMPMRSPDELAELRAYVLFNRLSQVGLTAPPLALSRPDGTPLDWRTGRARVLFFYDADCALCRAESERLQRWAEEMDPDVELDLIYTGSDAKAWALWRGKHPFPDGKQFHAEHLWDPEGVSDFPVKYAVTATPRLFFIDASGIIRGRLLDTDALVRLCASAKPVYGDGESVRMFGALLDALAPLKKEDLDLLSARIGARTLAMGDTVSFKQQTGNLLYALAARRSEDCDAVVRPWLKEQLFSRPAVWRTAEDTLQVLSLARLTDGLLALSPKGGKVPSVREAARQLVPDGKTVHRSLRRLSGRSKGAGGSL